MKRVPGKKAPLTRIGIYISDSGPYLKKNLDLRALALRLNKLPGVVTAPATPLPAGSKGESLLIRHIRGKKLNRVVVAAASPWLCEGAWGDCLEKAGINRYLLATADLSNYGLVPRRNKRKAAMGAEAIIQAAWRRVTKLEGIRRQKVKCSNRVLVIGGGLTGLSVARELSDLGHPVTVVEKSEIYGGLLRDLKVFFEDSPLVYRGGRLDPRVVIGGLVREIKRFPRNRFHNRTRVQKAQGQAGNFRVELVSPTKTWSGTFGAIVVASGITVVSPLPALKVRESPAITLLIKAYPFIERLFQILNPTTKVAFLMDVENEHGVVTTGKVLTSAMRARESGGQVTVFCRNVRVCAPGLEKLYRQARSQGILFTKFSGRPEVAIENNIITIRAFDEQMNQVNVSEHNLLIVAEYWKADDEGLTGILDLATDPENHLQEQNVWLYPVNSSRRGIFLAGACREPLTVKQAREEAATVAAEVSALLRGNAIRLDLNPATIDEEKCAFCLTCYRLCPHGAIEMDLENAVARVAEIACQSCGICAAECPARAIQLNHYTDRQLLAEVGSPPRLLLFACERSGAKAAEAAGRLGWAMPEEIQIIRVPCAGKVDSALILNCLERGAEKVLLLGCHRDNCHYLKGNLRADKRVEQIKQRLQEAGLNPERVAIGHLISGDGAKFIRYVEGACKV